MQTNSTHGHVLLLFSGQGSQHYHMGAELMGRDPHFRHAMEQLDAIAHRMLGESVIARAFDSRRNKSEPFGDSLFTHPAIFMVEYAMTRSLEERGLRPAAVLGASLGEYMAAVCARVMDVRTAFEFVIRQAQLFEMSCPPGAMMAILHSTDLYRTTPFLYCRAELVAENYSEHFVISGSVAELREIERFLGERNIICQMLAVSRAFHSSAMEPAAAAFGGLLDGNGFGAPELPFYSSVTGRRQLHFDVAYFWRLARHRICMREALQAAEADGPWLYVDAGPSATMATLGRNILGPNTSSEFFPLLSPYASIDRCLERLQMRRREILEGDGRAFAGALSVSPA
jgi:trans-AT polyketide synthase, acyltransferase and oxidoreductase domains